MDLFALRKTLFSNERLIFLKGFRNEEEYSSTFIDDIGMI